MYNKGIQQRAYVHRWGLIKTSLKKVSVKITSVLIFLRLKGGIKVTLNVSSEPQWSRAKRSLLEALLRGRRGAVTLGK